jgi:hypothetical protein
MDTQYAHTLQRDKRVTFIASGVVVLKLVPGQRQLGLQLGGDGTLFSLILREAEALSCNYQICAACSIFLLL